MSDNNLIKDAGYSGDEDEDAALKVDSPDVSDYSGDEVEDDDDLQVKSADDIDGNPLTALYHKLMSVSCIRRKIPHCGSTPVEDCNVYDFTHSARGLAVIINNQNFDGTHLDNRKSSKYDAQGLKQAFEHLGYKVKVYPNLEAAQMVLKLKKIAANLKYNHLEADSFVCAILTHGSCIRIASKLKLRYTERQDIVHGVDGVIVPVKYILNLFNDFCCPELAGKPRLFFIQACRGEIYDKGIDYLVWRRKKHQHSKKQSKGKDHTDAKSSLKEDLDSGSSDDNLLDEPDSRKYPKIIISPVPLYKDFLLMNASPPGYAAMRRDKLGSWFLQSLIDVILKCDPNTTPLMKMLTRVTNLVAIKYETYNEKNPSKCGMKQACCLTSMLTKDIFFTSKQ